MSEPGEEVEAEGVLVDRFELLEVIGRGGQGTTYLAHDRDSGQRVAVKELAVGKIDDWKAVELFEREGEALASLDHPAIPDYVTSFHLDEGTNGRQLFLVQEFVDGDDFKTLIEQGLRFDEEAARSFMRQMLDILEYIHGIEPPVIHRDIKPSNILRRPDGHLALVDFGAAQTIVPRDTGGSTVVGTTGYMPIEQLMGRAQPATDLYALGATAIHLLSHRHPSDLDVVEMALQFRSVIHVGDDFADLLGRLVEPHVEDRFGSATEAIAQLEALDAPSSAPPPALSQPAPTPKSAPLAKSPRQKSAERQAAANEHRELTGDYAFLNPLYNGECIPAPADTDITVHEDDAGASIHVPSMGLRGDALVYGAIYMVISVSVLGFFAAFLFGALQPTEGTSSGAICMLLPFVLLTPWLIYKAFQGVFEQVDIELDSNGMIVRRNLLGWTRSEFVSRESYKRVELVSDGGTGNRQRGSYRPTSWVIELTLRQGKLRLMDARQRDEQMWVAAVIRDHMTPG